MLFIIECCRVIAAIWLIAVLTYYYYYYIRADRPALNGLSSAAPCCVHSLVRVCLSGDIDNNNPCRHGVTLKIAFTESGGGRKNKHLRSSWRTPPSHTIRTLCVAGRMYWSVLPRLGREQ